MIDLTILVIAIIFIGILLTLLWLIIIIIKLVNISTDLNVIRKFLEGEDK